MNIKLSKYQESILKDMIKMNVFLVTNEGKNYSCWLEDKNGVKVRNINKITANILFRNNFITLIEDDTSRYYRYSLSSKSINLLTNIRKFI